MVCNVELHDAATGMRQHDHDEQDATGECGHGEEVHRRGRCEMIRVERFPRLRRRTWVAFEETGHGALRPVDPEYPQLAVNPRRAPEWIGRRHLFDQVDGTRIDGWPTLWSG